MLGGYLENDYYTVRITYTDFKTHKANGTIDKSLIRVDATPYNDLCAPKLTGTGDGILLSFEKVMVSSEAGIAEVKESINAAESVIEQIKGIIEEYFTN